MTQPDPPSAPAGEFKELRLALVLYGGVSLAIYMHGITKELQKLLVASAAYEADQRTNPFDDGRSEATYWRLLAGLDSGDVGAGSSGVRTRVTVDIVSGTSAGGMNGICLAKALTANRSQEAFTALWLENGDIAKLIRGPGRLPWRLRFATFLGEALISPNRVRPPLRGDLMSRWIHDAFAGMDVPPTGRRPLPGATTLLPAGTTLELFVPITDLPGFDELVPIDNPAVVLTSTHRVKLAFQHPPRPDRCGFGPKDSLALAFAARATSCFPGAFPPVGISDFEQETGTVGRELRALLPTLFPQYALAGVDVTGTHFIDGGVLDNAPFDSTIAAIQAKTASFEAQRRLLYLEPDPDRPARPAAPPTGGRGRPSYVHTLLAALSGIPRQQPILDSLTAVATRNEQVQRVRDVVEEGFDSIRPRISEIASGDRDTFPDAPTVEDLAAWRATVAGEASGEPMFATYERARVRSVMDGFAAAISRLQGFPAESYHAMWVTAVLRQWAADEHLVDQRGDHATRSAFLEALDLDRHGRHLRFIIAAFSWWYRDCGKEGFPSRAQLDTAKATVYALLGRLHGILDGAADATVRQAVDAVFRAEAIRQAVESRQSPESYVDTHRTDLASLREHVGSVVHAKLTLIMPELDAALIACSATWNGSVRRDLLVRHVGFELWDMLVFPLESLSGIGERDHVEVVRMSPFEATLLAPGEPKLEGVALGHFEAFFKRESRENDYLWGRLDAAEQLIRLLLEGPDRAAPAPPDELRTQACATFEAILTEERARLTHIPDRIDTLLARVKTLHGNGGGR